MAVKYVAIEGIIGSGKSTILQCLEAKNLIRDNCVFVEEPYYKFVEKCNYNPLSQLNKDPWRNAAISQLHIIETSFAAYPNKNILSGKNQNFISERSIFSPKVFVKAGHLMGFLSDFTRDYLLDELATKTLISGALEPSHYIFLRPDPFLCLTRVKIRNRESETNCTLVYEKMLDQLYVEELEAQDKPYFILQTVSSQTPGEIAKKLAEFIEAILNS